MEIEAGMLAAQRLWSNEPEIGYFRLRGDGIADIMGEFNLRDFIETVLIAAHPFRDH